ncbi:MAG: deoxyguanosinetriphosphate triphosphohydrolase [Armatimonadetes bacterium]|nr:deoxyguanosinetriphosphate triphosphohydrolase [Armatimonadota bacterium]
MQFCPRIIQEKKEVKFLSKYAALSFKTKGRLRKEEKCDIRTEFQRDWDRIIYSKSFRRLKHKTQVFLSPEGDHYRTRLTHTLEVSQISRTISRALNLNEDLTEAIALGHDLGHSPFGHAGESALDNIYKNYAPGAGFKHHEQSLRVVDYLERDGQGLNLTFEVREGILRHTKGREKMFNFKNKFSSLEAQIVKISDRLAYINHDIDDALRAKIIKENDLPEICLKILGKSTSSRINTMVRDVIENSFNQPKICMSKEVLKSTEVLKEFMFKKVYNNSPAKEDEEKAVNLIKKLFIYFMEYPLKLPKNVILDNLDLKKIEDRARIVCDYIAGMTDRYAMTLFKSIFIPKGWLY